LDRIPLRSCGRYLSLLNPRQVETTLLNPTQRRNAMPVLYKTDIASEADVKIHFTTIRSEADVVIFETTSQWEATSGAIWCYTDIRGEAAKTITITDSAWEADLIAFKTDVQSDAQWLNSGKSGLL